VMRTFSPDALIEVMCAIDQALTPKILLANYVFMTRGLPLLRGDVVKIIDTIDVFSSKCSKTAPFGIEDDVSMSEAERRICCREPTWFWRSNWRKRQSCGALRRTLAC